MLHNKYLRYVNWAEAKPLLRRAAPEIVELLSALNPGNKHRLLIASYPFGMNMMENGEFQLPVSHNEAASLTDPRLKSLKQEFGSYAKMPLGFILNKTMELFYQTNNRVICDTLLPPGSLVGTWEFFEKNLQSDTSRVVNLSAGVRSLFLLPLISDQVSHLRLKKAFKIASIPPQKLTDQCQLFTEIAQAMNCNWQCQVMFFNQAWFAERDSKEWLAFENALHKIAWQHSHSARRQLENSFGWENLLYDLSKRSSYLPPRLLSQLKHLFLLAEGLFPGMVFSLGDDDSLAPLPSLRDVYQDVYRLKNKAPIFMHPAYCNESTSVYYSLNYPGNLETFFPSKRVPRLMDELRAIIDTLRGLGDISNVMLSEKLLANFDFYHPAAKEEVDIGDLNCLVDNEPLIRDHLLETANDFPLKNSFLKGCIKVSIENEQVENNIISFQQDELIA